VSATTLARTAELLGSITPIGSFSARRTATAEDLHIEVTGVGPLRFPVSKNQAQQLRRIARPASYGLGEKTLLDRSVRDTSEIPRSRVKIDRKRWNRTLLPVLEVLGAELGTPAGCTLRAELHSMLIYGPGQFFLRHQDSEKADEMIGTLVVTLPSAFTGGALVVEHRGESVSYRAGKQPLSFVAFYADCHHEVRKVKTGYRIVLTYNLLLHGEAAPTGGGTTVPQTDALVASLREHFETPLPPRWGKDAPRNPPNRLVYLLDHQYTERGFGWHRLKGTDSARTAVLRTAAARAGCELVLALARVQETWDCLDDDWSRSSRWFRWRGWDEDEEGSGQDEAADESEGYTLGDLQDRTIELTTWVDPLGNRTEAIVTTVDDEEACATTPSAELEPYASEHEGYTGNAGNTVDRWYRRAAIVLWPRDRDFVVRAAASPAWAVATLAQRLRAGDATEAREMAAALLPFWKETAPLPEFRGLFGKVLRIAARLAEPELATALLQPFPLGRLAASQAKALVALVRCFGAAWTQALLVAWSGRRNSNFRFGEEDEPEPAWFAALPRLCSALRAADEDAGTLFAALLLESQWAGLRANLAAGCNASRPSERERTLTALSGPLRAFLESTAIIRSSALRDAAISFLVADDTEALLPCLVAVLRGAENSKPTARVAMGLDVIQSNCVARLEKRLRRPVRRADDWSLAAPLACDCKLCATLAAFLANSAQIQLEWPLAKERRRHLHDTLDRHELPVRHETRRQGSPFTLVLTKTKRLFERETAERQRWQSDLDWLAARTRGR
jgi:2OG-Fe(II) oxygenase superfamily